MPTFDRQDDATTSALRHSLPNFTFDRTAGSHSLAAAGQRERYAH
jgi:hypothetical protein